MQGLRIRERLSTQYATRVPKEITIEVEVESKPNDGGGFLMVEDGVVQPHALPRFQYVQEQDVLSSSVVRPPGTNKQGEREVRSIADGGDTGTRNFPHLSLEVVGAEDEDVHMEEVPVTAIEPNGAPRTMAELAEEATRTQRKRVRAPSEDDAEEIEEIQRVPAAEPPTKVNGTARTTRSSTRTKINPTPPNGSATKAHSQPVRRVSRKRAREPDTEDEADEGSDAAVDEESELSDVPSIAPPPSKRPSRTAKRAAAAPVPAPAPVSGGGRTLRARRTKSTAEVAEERKREAAYRRAIAQ